MTISESQRTMRNGLKESPFTQDFTEIDSELRAIKDGQLRTEGQILTLLSRMKQSQGVTFDTWSQADRLGLSSFLTRGELRESLPLVIDVNKDLKRISYGHLAQPLDPQELNAVDRKSLLFDASSFEVVPLLTVDNPVLISPTGQHLTNSKAHAREKQLLLDLLTRNQRITRFGQSVVTWDAKVDRDVWTTNIDTLFFIKTLSEQGVFARPHSKCLEVGTGGGGISQWLFMAGSGIREHTITDISPYALNCARRNIRPFQERSTQLSLVLGKGIRSIDDQFDLILTNPPYLPHPQGHNSVDPYRGTGLIREMFELAGSRLNPDNREAAVYIQISDLSRRDIEKYQREFPDVKVCFEVGRAMRVPLKIFNVTSNPEWVAFLRTQGLIVDDDLGDTTGFRYWHDISVIKLTLH